MRLGATFGVNSIRKACANRYDARADRGVVRVPGASFLKVSLCEGTRDGARISEISACRSGG